MKYWGTSSNYYSIEVVFFDCICYEGLTWMGTHILIVGAEYNSGIGFELLCEFFNIYGVGYISAAMADK
jgi:hypothetical protein